MKNYNPLYEFITMATVGAGMLGLSAIMTFKNMNQNAFNKKISKLFLQNLNQCHDKQTAINIINNFCNRLQNFNTDKSIVKKLAIAQNFLKLNYYAPCLKIIQQYDDNTWKQELLKFTKSNSRKLAFKSGLRTTANVGSLALSGGAMAGNAVMGMAAMANGIYRIISRNLKYFNANRYINKLIKELQACSDTDLNSALNIVIKYSYSISTDIQNNVQKTKVKIPFNIQEKIRQQFLPLLNIIQQGDPYWKIKCIDYLKTNKIQEGTQVICDSVLHYIMPYTMREMRK
jgi:hypothetical protein